MIVPVLIASLRTECRYALQISVFIVWSGRVRGICVSPANPTCTYLRAQRQQLQSCLLPNVVPLALQAIAFGIKKACI